MGIFFLGSTKCCICGNPIQEARDLVGFPAFLKPGHRFHPYSDGAFHSRCFLEWPERVEFEGLYKRFREIWDTRPEGPISIPEMNAWGQEAFKEFDKE